MRLRVIRALGSAPRGATIDEAPATQFYGDRTYRARDPEGHIWTFSQTVEVMEPKEWDEKTGLKTWMRK